MRNWVWLRNEGSEGPGRASSRRVELPNSDPAPQVWRAPEGPEGLAAVPVGGGGAWSRCRWVAAGPGRASRSTTPSRQARVWRSRGRAAAHRHTQRPGPSRQGSGARNTSGATSINTRRRRLAGGPPPTGTQSDQTELGRSCAVDGGWAAAHRHPQRPGLTRQKILQPEVWQLVQRLNSAQDAQQLEPQQINEKRPPSHQHSQLHSNMPKSHMRNMRAS